MTEYNKVITTVNSVTQDYSFIPDQNSVIVIDTSENRIGINTFNPLFSIDVSNGTIRTQDLIVLGNFSSSTNSGTFDSDIVPQQSQTYDLGSNLPSNLQWRDLYLSRRFYLNNIDFISIAGFGNDVIAINNTNSFIDISDLDYLNIRSDVLMQGNIGIGTTNPLVSIDINRTDAIRLPVGNNSQRPTGIDGYIRYNSQINTFEGYGSGNWGTLGGVKDVNQDTYISAELSPGINNDELIFYTNGIQRLLIGSTGNYNFNAAEFNIISNNFDLSSQLIDISSNYFNLHTNFIDISSQSGYVNIKPTVKINNFYTLPTTQGTISQIIQYGIGDTTEWVNGPATEFNSTGLKSRHSGTNVNPINSISLGLQAGSTNQSQNAIALGYQSGNNNQNEYSIAIGYQSGLNNLGQDSIAIGRLSNIIDNSSIIINATGSSIITDGSGLYIAPINNLVTSNGLFYNPINGKITYGGTISNPSTSDLDMNNFKILNVADISINNDLYVTGHTYLRNMTISGHLLPTEDGVYDIGSATKKIRDLYLTGGTLYMDDGNSGIIDVIKVTNGVATFKGTLDIPDNSNSIAYFNYVEVSGNLTGDISATALTINSAYQMPTTIGTANQILTVPASGNTLEFTTPSAGATSIVNTQTLISSNTGTTTTGDYSIILGYNCNLPTNSNNIIIGRESGNLSPYSNMITLGYQNCLTGGSNSIAIGNQSAKNNCGPFCVSIGTNAGENSLGNNSVAIGWLSSNNTARNNSVSIGIEAGKNYLGQYSIAIGSSAAKNSALNTSDFSGCIVLNAQNNGAELNPTQAGQFLVKPIRYATGTYGLFYDSGTGEITYNTGAGGATTIFGTGFKSNNATIVNSTGGIALGVNSSSNDTNAIAIGNSSSAALNSIAIGASCSSTIYDVILGKDSGGNNYSVSIGYATHAGTYGVSIGSYISSATNGSITLNGTNSILNNNINDSLVIKPIRGPTNFTNILYYNTGTGEICYDVYPTAASSAATIINNGFRSNNTGTLNGVDSVSIGTECGNTNQGLRSVAIGYRAGNVNQGDYSIAIGFESSENNSGTNAITFGYQCNNNGGSNYCFLAGHQAAYDGTGNDSIVIGTQACYTNNQNYIVGLGYRAGYGGLREKCIAIGYQAGYTNTGQSSIYIGNNAGLNGNFFTNCIVLNAMTGTELNPQANGGFFVKPMNSSTSPNDILFYDTGSGEILYGNKNSITSDIRLKHNIEDLSKNKLNFINKLKIKKFIKCEKLHASQEQINNGYKTVGIIAQDLLQIDPELVIDGDYYDNSGNFIEKPYSIKINDIYIYNIAATQELSKKVENLEIELSTLKNENTLLKNALNQLLQDAGKPTI